MPDIKYVVVQEDYYETDNETGKPRLIHAAGARIQERAARAYGDAIKTKEGPPEVSGAGAGEALPPFDATVERTFPSSKPVKKG